ncbi:MAG: histidine phosphatase family protein [Acidobacteria bacterium]|nr:histidine phosphatase family protein [Acidobacteriota bacterium]
MTPLYLLRHGPTAASQSGAPLGRMDLPVTEEGERRWPLVKAQLQSLGLHRVLTSNLRRARLHAEDMGLPLLILDGLAEQAFGEWEGLPWADIKGAEGFFANPVLGNPPGGESFARCASRAVQAVQGALSGEEPILVLAHGGSLRAILAHFMGLSLERALDLAWQPFGLSKLEVHGPNKAVLRFHNQALG